MNMLRKRKREKMGVREPEQLRSPGHLRFIRLHCCLIGGRAGHVCQGKIEAHHVREGSNGGIGMKSDDSDAVPLCSLAHATFHNMGPKSFALKYSIDLPKAADEFWQKSPHRQRHDHG